MASEQHIERRGVGEREEEGELISVARTTTAAAGRGLDGGATARLAAQRVRRARTRRRRRHSDGAGDTESEGEARRSGAGRETRHLGEENCASCEEIVRGGSKEMNRALLTRGPWLGSGGGGGLHAVVRAGARRARCWARRWRGRGPGRLGAWAARRAGLPWRGRRAGPRARAGGAGRAQGSWAARRAWAHEKSADTSGPRERKERGKGGNGWASRAGPGRELG
jgi:hypothetical protein